jgi:hypothetical protein
LTPGDTALKNIKKLRSPTFEIQFSDKLSSDEITLQIMREGVFNHPWFGKFNITPKMLNKFCSNYKKKVLGVDIALDYSHKAGDEAAGWFTDLFCKPDVNDKKKTALFGTVKLTPKAVQKINEREFRYTSADFTEQFIDNETGNELGPVLYGAALTNRPFIKGMDSVIQLSEENENDLTKGDIMDMEKLMEENASLKVKLEKLETDHKILSDAAPVADEKIKALEAQNKILSDESEANKKAAELAKKESEFTKLLTDGKAIPAQKDAFMAGDLAKFAELASNVTVNPDRKSTGANPPNQPEGLTEEGARQQLSDLTDVKLAELKISDVEKARKFSEVFKQVRAENPELEKIAFPKN